MLGGHNQIGSQRFNNVQIQPGDLVKVNEYGQAYYVRNSPKMTDFDRVHSITFFCLGEHVLVLASVIPDEDDTNFTWCCVLKKGSGVCWGKTHWFDKL